MLKHLLFMKRFYVKPPLYLIPLTILVLIAGCGLKQFNSHWLDREIVIDGDRSDWSDALTYLEKMDVSIGFLNNNETFYICLATGNRQLTRQIMARGLVLWFNARGNKSKEFGVKYPLGRMTMGMPRQEEMFPPNEGDMEQQDQHRPFPFEVSQELEILGPEKNDFSRMTRSEILAAGVDMCTDIKMMYLCTS